MVGKVRISPSILAADMAHIAAELHRLEEGGADMVHVDVMDGHFVPNISFGSKFVHDMAAITSLPLDIHLMVSDPYRWIPEFYDLKPYSLLFHLEATPLPVRLLQDIRAHGILCGLAINPSTPWQHLESIAPILDMVLVMTVEPGFYGQSYLPWAGSKIEAIDKNIRPRNQNLIISVDGGVNEKNAPHLAQTGADILVAGGSVFKGESYKDNIDRLRNT